VQPREVSRELRLSPRCAEPRSRSLCSLCGARRGLCVRRCALRRAAAATGPSAHLLAPLFPPRLSPALPSFQPPCALCWQSCARPRWRWRSGSPCWRSPPTRSPHAPAVAWADAPSAVAGAL